MIDAARHPALLLVDAVSSLGAIDYRHDEWGVDVTVSSSQKGMMLTVTSTPCGDSRLRRVDDAPVDQQQRRVPRRVNHAAHRRDVAGPLR